MSHTRPVRALALATTVLTLAPAAALAAKPTSQAGAFSASNKTGSRDVSLGVSQGRINNVFAMLGLSRHGKKCPGSGTGQATQFTLSLKSPVRPSKSGAFSFASSRARAGSSTGAKVSVSGRFTSSSKARVKVTGSFKGCTGSYTATAKFGREG